MPLILPPADAPGGWGTAIGRDCFALGLLLAGLVRCAKTETRDLYTGNELRREWSRCARTMSLAAESVILGLADLNPRHRLSARRAAELLPPPASWFDGGANCDEEGLIHI